ncbi:MAG: putative sulfate exporter family transporter [Candidatus Competibacterales bacterium]|nr:putative sulfate exporter family transporter [Candidatus Competibacterales bacterium]
MATLYATVIDRTQTVSRGTILALTIAAAASFLSTHYGAPAMLFALLLGIAFNFLATESSCKPGIEFSSKALLRIGVALLGVRLTLSDMAELGLTPVIGVICLVTLTVGSGLAFAPALGRRWRFGLLTGGSVAICGASAALAIAAILHTDKRSENDTIFTVVAVTTLSTIAMIGYPILFTAIGASESEIGFLIGATIHDVAQVVGAGFSVSETAGNLATYVKLQRVALLPVLLLVIIFSTPREPGQKATMPWFVIAFVVLVAINSAGLIPGPIRDFASDLSRWLLMTAIAALGVKTSLKAIAAVGPRHVGVVVAETVLLLIAAIGFVYIWRMVQ